MEPSDIRLRQAARISELQLALRELIDKLEKALPADDPILVQSRAVLMNLPLDDLSKKE